MVSIIKPIISASNAGRYFYFTESNYECGKGWHKNEAYLIIDNYKNLIRSLSKKRGDKTSSIEHQTIEKSVIKSTDMGRNEEFGIINVAKSHLTDKIGNLMNEYQNIKGINGKAGLNKEVSSDIYGIANKVSRLKKEIEVQERKGFYKDELQKQNKTGMRDLEVVDKVRALAKIGDK